MHPILFTLGPFTLYSYGLTLVIAFLVSMWLARRAARALPPDLLAIPEEQLLDFTSCSLLGGILGGRLLYVVLQWDYFVQTPQQVLAIWNGGLVWYGGFVGGLVAGWLYMRVKRLQLLRVLDQFIPFGVLGHAIGRVGCFLNGCCYGKPTASWCGVVFPGHPTPVLPTQLFEAAGLLFLYALLRALQRPAMVRYPGRLFGVYLALYAVLRFFMEFLRGDQAIVWAVFTLQQLISVGVFLIGLCLLRGSNPQSPPHGLANSPILTARLSGSARHSSTAGVRQSRVEDATLGGGRNPQ